MRRQTIRIIVLSVVFVIALFVTGYLTNRGNAGMTAEMSYATLPTISFTSNKQEVNPLVGHKEEMDISAVRETVLPLDSDGKISVNIQKYGREISGLTYEILSLDGSEKLAGKKEDKVEKTVVIDTDGILEENQEALLKIRLHLGEEQSVYFYTRLVHVTDSYFKECMKYVNVLHENMLEGKETASIEKVLESNSEGDNTSLQHVTIHSNLEHVTWGDLSPQIIGDIRWSIQEVKPAYISICLKYQVECKGDDKGKDIHHVKEFFRVRFAKDKCYLLTYDRTLEEVFDGNKDALTSKGISLGMAAQDTRYKANKDGTIVSFIQANELWSYNKEEGEFALVFSFDDSEKEDIRHRYDAHSLKILSMEENGNLTFAVYGYMNRGNHEGQSGAAIYYFNLAQNIVEEKAFIPSNKSYISIEKELGKLAYYNDKENTLYVMAAGELCKVDLKTNEKTTVLKGLGSNQYVSSEDGSMIAYQKKDSEAIVIDFAKASEQNIKAPTGEIIQPLGFVMGDFVYGVAKSTDKGILPSGETALGMYKLEIRNAKNKVVKDYQVNGTYILGVKIDGNMLKLNRGTLQNGMYAKIPEDYITNNEGKNSTISLQVYQTSVKETQIRLTFEKEIKDKKAKVLKPKQVLFERDTTMEFDTGTEKPQYSVFALGEITGVYEEAGEAIQVARKNAGVVISPKQNYIWEDGNRASWYRNFEIPAFHVRDGESAFGACLRAVLSYEGVSIDVMSELSRKSALEVLELYCGDEAVQLKDSTVSSMRYLIDKGIPVIALTGRDSAVVLVGYDAKTVTYMDPHDGVARTRNFSAVDSMMSGSGNTFLAYVK